MSDGWRSYSSAPETGALVCASSEIDEGVARCLSVQTERGIFPLLLVRKSGRVRAFVNACPHQYLPLDYRSDSVLSADGARFLCSAHGAAFDVTTGACLSGDAAEGLDPVPIAEDANGNLRIGA
ncbi:nitrite reductase/ring-hydroxylating ferredoxin subunit [Neorhizobium sp. R1-B]|jgi:nitrite reductase/ring-hydroxylating ferredoxin subunit|uniref:Rieske (2Fe-2S) protein n=1 Tax=Neorhizobium TaxID=1525371 RepID=UPI000CF8B423|nr:MULTISPECIES: Rieske 2Fe-2S domain-containing protein [Neorhizobium]TCV73705.1 nitrite reductase/ring-hydroxylating ferredoxin subunit [Neorhizobium sp. S3-V5DH]TDX85558.1 nitrite reductase/ring-hydroxylating ferredoxin subunit [Neorhizobium sp. R1-B]